MDGIYRSEWIWVVEQRHIKKNYGLLQHVFTMTDGFYPQPPNYSPYIAATITKKKKES